MTVIRARTATPPGLILALAILVPACAAPGDSPDLATAPASSTPEPREADATVSAEPSATDPIVAEVEVRVEGARFEPAELTVAAGTAVVFVNADDYGHTVTEGTDGQPVANAFVDEELPANSTLWVEFSEPDTFDITCIIHPTMQMTITVED